MVVGALLVLAALGLLLLSLFSSELFPEYSPAHRGREVAVQAGCFSCHGGLLAGVPSVNPARGLERSVPGILEERHSPEELRQWIVDGVSESHRNSAAFIHSRENSVLQMPAFGERLTPGEIDDLAAFVGLSQYGESARLHGSTREGESLARRLACFTCHGELGQGGVENPGSLKGYIPGFFGSDFRALTRNGNRQDIREWILKGRSDYFWNQGFAGIYPGRYFTDRQAIRMPAYEGFISESEVEILTDYLIEMMELGPMALGDLLEYRPIGSREVTPSASPSTRSGSEAMDPAGPAADIHELIEEYCSRCHGPEKQRSSYRLDRRDEALAGGEIAEFTGRQAIVPGDPEASMLMLFVRASEEDPFEEIYPMPPLDQPRLNAEQIEHLEEWIRDGAPW
jgi:mono/diheme cytochrome c family protein